MALRLLFIYLINQERSCPVSPVLLRSLAKYVLVARRELSSGDRFHER
jgi:hypothetical protein